MANKDIKLNIKLDMPAEQQNNGFLNKLVLALGLSLSTTLTNNLDFNNLTIIVCLVSIIIAIAFITSKKGKK